MMCRIASVGVDSSADAVLAIGLLHHLDDDECVQLLASVAGC